MHGYAQREPVEDWATDFDHLSADYAQAAPEIWADLRERCPVAHTNRFGGAWLPTRYDDIAAIAHDTATFSNRSVVVNEYPQRTSLMTPPINLDPPLHGQLRRAVLPPFNPRAIAELEPWLVSRCDELIDEILARPERRADAAIDYAQIIPVEVIARLLGLPAEDAHRFRSWITDLLQIGPSDLEVAQRVSREVLAYFADQRARRTEQPGDDLVTYLLHAEAPTDEGGARPLDDREQLGILFLLLIAGVDTTWSSIGASLYHLATHPEDRARLVAEPSLIPVAVEEFLRYYAPVTLARVAAHDGEVGGHPVHAGERVLLPFPAANRDPAAFERADEVVIDRAENRHLAFGVGIHRCLGSNLARLEMRVTLERWLARIPEFSLEPGATVPWSAGQIRGPRTVPLCLG